MEIKNTSEINNGGKFRFLVYGQSGAGKTRLISTIPKDCLILDTDKGLKSIKHLALDYKTASSWDEVKEFFVYLKTDECKKKYSWIVLDTLTVILDFYMKELIAKEEKKSKPDKYNIYSEFLKFALNLFAMIRDQDHYNFLVLSQLMERENDSGISEKTYCIPGQARNRISEFFDEVYALRIEKDDTRTLQTMPSLGWACKTRSDLNKIEPADINSIMHKIKGGKK